MGCQAASHTSIRSILSNPTGHPFALLPLKGAQHKDKPHRHLPLWLGYPISLPLQALNKPLKVKRMLPACRAIKRSIQGVTTPMFQLQKQGKGRSKNKQILDYKIQQQATNSLETKEKKLFDIMQNEKICEFNKLTLPWPTSSSLSLSLSFSSLLCCSCGKRQHVIWPIAVDLALKRISLNVAAGKDGDAVLNVLVALQQNVLDARRRQ